MAKGDTDPAWSPDGGSISFVRRRQGASVGDIWVMNPTGGGGGGCGCPHPEMQGRHTACGAAARNPQSMSAPKRKLIALIAAAAPVVAAILVAMQASGHSG